MGREITVGYSVEEEHNLEIYKTLITVGAQYIEDLSRQAQDEKAVDPYAVINNTVIAAGSWADHEAHNASETEWYQQVLEVEGEIIFTDVYIDAIYHKPVITIARECGDTGNVFETSGQLSGSSLYIRGYYC